MISKTKTIGFILVIFTIAACTSNPDRQRSAGTIIDDNFLEVIIERKIKSADEAYKGSHIVVTVYDGLVLLLGQVPSDELKALATQSTEGLNKVKAGNVHNHLTVEGPISYLARANDSLLSGDVKVRLLTNREVPGTKIKVKTEDGVIYLLGKITRAQAEAAVTATQRSFGVRKIVKVFDYLDEND